MKKNRPLLRKKKLALAVGMIVLSGAMTGCSDSSSGPAPGAFTIFGNGGLAGSEDGSTYIYGGEGGLLSMVNYGGTGGVEVRKTGTANTAFTSPITPAATDLGDNPLTISADTTLGVVDYDNPVADAAGAFTAGDLYVGTDDVIRTSVAGGAANYAADTAMAAGTAYLRLNRTEIYMSDGGVAADDSMASGLSVAAGATLTVGDNSPCNGQIAVLNDIENAGIITKNANACDLYLYADRYLGSGSLVNAGTMATPNAGRIYVYAATGIANSGTVDTSGYDDPAGNGGQSDDIRLDAAGYVINDGMLNASGGDGMGAGGTAQNSDVRLYGAYVENNGTIDVSGGNNTDVGTTAGNGGSAGFFYIEADYVTNNTGDIDASGGDGDFGGHGTGLAFCCNSSRMDNNEQGEVKNAGAINLSGGIGYANDGGDGGEMEMVAYGGDALNDGDLTANGGDSMDDTSNGGDGGEFRFYSYPGDNAVENGNLVVSGNIAVNGGNAVTTATGSGDGGWGGVVYMYMDGAEAAQRVALLGYTNIDLNGGDGGEFSGYGGEVNLYTSYEFNESTQQYSAGSVYNDVPLNLYGGSTTKVDGGEGGSGGWVSMGTSTGEEVKNLGITMTNNAAINAYGGSGVFIDTGSFGEMNGGYGGYVNLYAYQATTNTGAVDVSGGDGGEGSNGNDAGYAGLYTEAGASTNSGEINASGGDGAQYGGEGGFFWVQGASASNSAAVNVNGANATNFGVGPYYTMTFGGDGGEVTILGAGLNGPASNSGMVSYAPGSGIESGDIGCLQVGITFEGLCF